MRNLARQHVAAKATLRFWAIVDAAIAPEPDRRHGSAHAFHARLTSGRPAERLLKRMEENEDFPAMTHAVSRIQAMVASDTESVGAVAGEILKDVALSNKLLRIVNSAYYARGGGISTISRAVTLIGFNGVRNMAMGLVLLEGMADKAHALVLTEEFLRALMAASIARELVSEGRDGEEAFIGAMFQDLGRLLAMYYFPKEAQQVQLLVDGAGKLTENSASTRVLGLGYEALGQGVAKLWDLPPDIRRHMHKPPGSRQPVRPPTCRSRCAGPRWRPTSWPIPCCTLGRPSSSPGSMRCANASRAPLTARRTRYATPWSAHVSGWLNCPP